MVVVLIPSITYLLRTSLGSDEKVVALILLFESPRETEVVTPVKVNKLGLLKVDLKV